MRTFAWVMALGIVACGSPPPATPRGAAASKSEPLPPPAPAAALSTDEVRCGVFSSKELEEDAELLDHRLRVAFVPGGLPQGDARANRVLIERDGQSLFVGARETFQRGDAEFARRASQRATFGGGYVPSTISGKLQVIAGFTKAPEDGNVFAHGWLLDADRNVIDVAVSTDAAVVRDHADECSKFAQKIFASMQLGARRLQYGGGEQQMQVSYASFRYRLPDDWIVMNTMGIHDFARMHFQKRGVFAVSGGATLQLALDSHPGDWTTPGRETGKRSGKLLGMKVSWHLTENAADGEFGAWTVSDGVEQRDHAVGAVVSDNADDRDDAVRFAETIKVGR